VCGCLAFSFLAYLSPDASVLLISPYRVESTADGNLGFLAARAGGRLDDWLVINGLQILIGNGLMGRRVNIAVMENGGE